MRTALIGWGSAAIAAVGLLGLGVAWLREFDCCNGGHE